MKIGFIGLGNVGGKLAGSILRNGADLHVRDLDDALVQEIRTRIRTRLSPRHVPDDVIAAPGIPHTRTGKKLEVPVTAIMAGHTEVSLDPRAIDRPDLIDWYRERGRERVDRKDA